MTLADEYRAFMDANPHIWREFCAVAAEVLAAGYTSYSADAVLHVVRWRHRRKVPNAYTPFLARQWLATHPHAPRLFALKPSMADTMPPIPSPQMSLGL